MQPHKILITGTFDSGKTELIRMFSSDPNVAIVSEVARDVLAIDPSLQSKPGFQDILLREQLRSEAIAEATGKPIILCDRGSLDIIAFSLALGIPIRNEWLELTLGRYRSIMICDSRDIPPSIGEGEERLASQSFRNIIDKRIRQVINDLAEIDPIKPSIHEVSGTLIERKSYLSQYIELTMSLREGNLLNRER